MLVLSIITGVILVLSLIFAVINYKDKLGLWLTITVIFTIIFGICLGLYARQQNKEERMKNLNACESFLGKYIVIGQEKVMVGKVLKTVDIYGCVK